MNMAPLSSACDIIMGQAPSGETYNEEKIGLPLIAGASDFGELSPRPSRYTTKPSKKSQTGDIVLCIRATIGDLNWSDREYCLGRGVAGLRVKPTKADAKYIWHAIGASAERLSALGRGATFKQVSRADIADLEIPLPPLAEQKRIAAILDQADALRRLRQHSLDRLNQLGQAIFYEMFGDPATNPKEWAPITLGDVVHSVSDGPHVSPKYAEEGIPFLSTRHIRPGSVFWEDIKYISPEDARIHWKKCKPEKGDILYTKGGTTGIAATVDFDIEIAVWVHVALLKTDRSKVDPYWLETMLNSNFCYLQSQRFTHGIANRDLGLKRMVNIKMFLPPLNQQMEFVERLKIVRSNLAANIQSVQKLTGLFSSLQHRAFSGEL